MRINTCHQMRSSSSFRNGKSPGFVVIAAFDVLFLQEMTESAIENMNLEKTSAFGVRG
jgi:hypothetical protein